MLVALPVNTKTPIERDVTGFEDRNMRIGRFGDEFNWFRFTGNG